jgi:ribosome-associated protein
LKSTNFTGINLSQKLKEKSLLPDAQGSPGMSGATGDGGLDERILQALAAAAEKKALDLVVLDLRAIASFTDFFVITSGTNRRQVQAISDGVVEHLKKNGTRAARVEGYQTAEWILVDYGDFILHVFDEKARRFYDLERLWREAVRVALPPDKSGAAGSLREK